jgi:CheY-like chemotaxis protein
LTFMGHLPPFQLHGGEAVGAKPTYRILFVDDNADTRVVTGMMLRRSGHSVTSAGTCAEAIDRAKEERFDLLITDIGLPDGDGLGLLFHIQSQYPIVGIVLSGYGMAKDIHRALAAGFARHVLKPVDGTTLCAAVDQVMDPGAGESAKCAT